MREYTVPHTHVLMYVHKFIRTYTLRTKLSSINESNEANMSYQLLLVRTTARTDITTSIVTRSRSQILISTVSDKILSFDTFYQFLTTPRPPRFSLFVNLSISSFLELKKGIKKIEF